jgi:hypothetical protein
MLALLEKKSNSSRFDVGFVRKEKQNSSRLDVGFVRKEIQIQVYFLFWFDKKFLS